MNFATTFHSIMSRDKVDGNEMERNLHGGEKNVDMELCSQLIPGDSYAQEVEKEEDLNPAVRMRKGNTKDCGDVEAEAIYHARRSLGGYIFWGSDCRIPGPAINMCRCALKNEVYNNSCYSYSMRCK